MCFLGWVALCVCMYFFSPFTLFSLIVSTFFPLWPCDNQIVMLCWKETSYFFFVCACFRFFFLFFFGLDWAGRVVGDINGIIIWSLLVFVNYFVSYISIFFSGLGIGFLSFLVAVKIFTLGGISVSYLSSLTKVGPLSIFFYPEIKYSLQRSVKENQRC